MAVFRVPSPVSLLHFCVALPLLAALICTVAETDVWGHLRFGLDTMETWKLPARDPYSFTSDRAWINHEWLAQLSFAIAYRLMGAIGLIVLKTAVLGGVLLLVSARPQPAVGIAVAGATLVMWPVLSQVRPQIYSLLLFTAVIALLDTAPRRLPLWLATLFALWANLHGGWMLGAVVVVVWALTNRQWTTMGVALGATLCTPYGWRLWEALLRATLEGWREVSEWQPIYRLVWDVVWWGGIAAACTAASLFRVRPVPRWLVAATGVVGLSAFRASRLIAFFGLIVVTAWIPRLTPLRPRVAALPWSRQARVVVLVCLCGAVTMASMIAKGQTNCVEVVPSLLPESETATVVRALQGRMLTFFDYGLYAIWQKRPDLLISYDGRRETVYSPRIQRRHARFYSGEDPTYPEKLAVDYVWLPRAAAAVAQLQAEGWFTVFQGPRSAILARRPIMIPAGPAPRLPRCFPAP